MIAVRRSQPGKKMAAGRTAEPAAMELVQMQLASPVEKKGFGEILQIPT